MLKKLGRSNAIFIISSPINKDLERVYSTLLYFYDPEPLAIETGNKKCFFEKVIIFAFQKKIGSALAQRQFKKNKTRSGYLTSFVTINKFL